MKQDYDPFIAGPFTIHTREFETVDLKRQSRFPCHLWYPAEAGRYPLVIYSHPSTFHRKAATFLCMHLTSHGYVVAAMDHSESVVPELKRPQEETAEQQAARWQAAIDSRVPDVRLLLDRVLDEQASRIEFDQVGIVGHSFGGWTALAAPEVEPRIRSVVALAPAGASNPRPGVLRGRAASGQNIRVGKTGRRYGRLRDGPNWQDHSHHDHARKDVLMFVSLLSQNMPMMPVPKLGKLVPGHTLSVIILKKPDQVFDPSIDLHLRIAVLDDGTTSVPLLIERIPAAGLSISQLNADLEQRYTWYFQHFGPEPNFTPPFVAIGFMAILARQSWITSSSAFRYGIRPSVREM